MLTGTQEETNHVSHVRIEIKSYRQAPQGLPTDARLPQRLTAEFFKSGRIFSLYFMV